VKYYEKGADCVSLPRNRIISTRKQQTNSAQAGYIGRPLPKHLTQCTDLQRRRTGKSRVSNESN